MKKTFYIFSALLVAMLALQGCQKKARVPEFFKTTKNPVLIYPDYHNVVVPQNIAPLTFHVENEADEVVAQLTDGQHTFAYRGPDIEPRMDDWRQLSGDISVEVFVRKGEEWQLLQPFSITISPDSIDPYISYRLIAPSYVTYEDLTICQRNLENYDEKVIYGNMANSDERDGQCINCHSYQNYDPNTFQFHVRQAHGGTLIVSDGKIERINMNTGKTVSAGVYPAWHPTEKLIAYSTNKTGQSFHTHSNQKVEVQDTYSDLMLYDVERHTVQPLPSDTNQLDCYPHWSPDGRNLYYCSALYLKHDSSETVSKEFDMIQNYKDIRYNLYRRSFDPQSRRFGEPELVYDAAADSMSATLPRVSPDGRWLMFTRGAYGVFHIWHTDADLWLLDLKNGEARPLDELNSDNVESYHSWSSNGRWVIFSSRRDDGNFTRPFIAHIATDGSVSRPFELPSRHPLYHRELMRSYNIPEFMKGPVTVRPQDLAAACLQDSIKATVAEN